MSFLEVDGKQLIDPGVIPAGSLNSSFYNQSQTWSNNAVTTGNGGTWGNLANLFSGDLSTFAHANTNGSAVTVTLTFSPALSTTSGVKVWGGMTSSNVIFRVNNEANAAFNNANYNSVENFYSFTGDVSTITIGNSDGTNASASGLYLYGVEVDGKLLVNPTVSVTNFPTIASTCRANPTAGFSIVSYTGTGSDATVGHGLNAQPYMVVLKDRSAANAWAVQHVGTTLGSGLLKLNSTAAVSTGVADPVWNSTAPTSSVFSVGTSSDTNGSGNTYIAYCFAPVEGYSAFGKFSGNSSTDGPFQYCGFKPRFLLLKGITQARDWIILDTERDAGNVGDSYLHSNTNGAENTYAIADILSNGFKMRYAGGLANQTGEDYIWAAFASHPFKTARAR